MWLTNTLQTALITYFYPDRYVAAGNTAGAAQVKARAQARVGELLLQVDAELAQVQGQCAGAEFWFMGSDYTLLDAYLFTLCRWTRNFSAHPARGHPHLGPYLHRMLARPAVRRVYAQEGIIAPLI
jgi:glutathione S-transferase